LDLYLREKGITTLILCGLDTNICVAHTAADAFYNMYDLYVVSDATATFLIGNQADGLQFMKTCYGAKVLTTNELLPAFAD
jgi:nicotinamidase-related amidase